MEVTAEKNTWSNSRKKRRQEKNKQMISKVANIRIEENNEVFTTESNDHMEIDADKGSECDVPSAVSITKEIVTNKNDSQISNSNQENRDRAEKNDIKRKMTADDDERSSVSSVKKPKLEESSPQLTSRLKKDVFLSCSLVVKDDPKGSLVEVGWLGGGGGREAAHQVLHYFKNNIKTH